MCFGFRQPLRHRRLGNAHYASDLGLGKAAHMDANHDQAILRIKTRQRFTHGDCGCPPVSRIRTFMGNSDLGERNLFLIVLGRDGPVAGVTQVLLSVIVIV